MYTAHRARIESQLAKAHRAVTEAMTAAEMDGDVTLGLDLQMLQVELTRLAEASLRGKARRSLLAPGRQT